MPQPKPAHSRPPVSAWQAELLRLTVFPAPNSFDHTKWWRDVVGAEPDNVISQPKQSLYQESGKLDEQRVMVLHVQPPRIEWRTMPVESETPSPEFATFAALPEALSQFATSLNRWLESCPPVTRFALGGVLLQPQPDRKAGYRQLGAYLGESVKLDPESSDFMYQINRPRPSEAGVPGLQINRLTKWTVALHRTVVFVSGQEEASLSTVAQQSACRLELDINTSQDFKGPLPQDKLRDLLAEFVRFALEIAEKGDVK